jgi:hypothetical protein
MANSDTGHGMACVSSGVKDLTSRCLMIVGCRDAYSRYESWIVEPPP